MEHWIYVLLQIGSVFFWVLSIAGISDALCKVRFVDSFLSAIMYSVLSVIFGCVAWWLWV